MSIKQHCTLFTQHVAYGFICLSLYEKFMRSNDALDVYRRFHFKHLLHVLYIVRNYILDVPIRSAPKFVFLMPLFSPLPHQFSSLATGPKTLEQILHMVFFIVCPPLMDNLLTY